MIFLRNGDLNKTWYLCCSGLIFTSAIGLLRIPVGGDEISQCVVRSANGYQLNYWDQIVEKQREGVAPSSTSFQFYTQ